MKKSELRQIIREEIKKVLNENKYELFSWKDRLNTSASGYVSPEKMKKILTSYGKELIKNAKTIIPSRKIDKEMSGYSKAGSYGQSMGKFKIWWKVNWNKDEQQERKDAEKIHKKLSKILPKTKWKLRVTSLEMSGDKDDWIFTVAIDNVWNLKK